jgi:hypothetical protein
MWIASSAAVLASLVGMQQAPPQQGPANPQIVAQAYDRCMATHAVRLTRTSATDENIYTQASQSCLPLNDQLTAAIKAQLPPAQADEILRTLAANGKPNFLSMLARIRSDRARKSGE